MFCARKSTQRWVSEKTVGVDANVILSDGTSDMNQIRVVQGLEGKGMKSNLHTIRSRRSDLKRANTCFN